MERRVLFTALVGSHNYNLNDEHSDKDYKEFVIPTFDDLYSGKEYSNSVVGADKDVTTHDIRKLSHLWWKANLNFLEVLYSRDLKLTGATPEDWEDFKKIINMREKIVRMNLPYLYNACFGMYTAKITKMNQLHKGTSGTKHLVEKYGYDTKQAVSAYRILDFLVRFAETNDFQKAMVYKGKEREFMLALKRGGADLDSFVSMVTDLRHKANSDEVKNFYMSSKPDEETKAELEEIIKDIVYREVTA